MVGKLCRVASLQQEILRPVSAAAIDGAAVGLARRDTATHVIVVAAPYCRIKLELQVFLPLMLQQLRERQTPGLPNQSLASAAAAAVRPAFPYLDVLN